MSEAYDEGFVPQRVGVELPAKADNRRSRFAKVINTLKAEPGIWYVIREYPGKVTVSGDITRSLRRHGSFEVTQRIVGEKTLVYARYVRSGHETG